MVTPKNARAARQIGRPSDRGESEFKLIAAIKTRRSTLAEVLPRRDTLDGVVRAEAKSELRKPAAARTRVLGHSGDEVSRGRRVSAVRLDESVACAPNRDADSI